MAMLNNQRVAIESTVTWSKAEDVARATAGKERNAERARTVCKPIKALQIDWRQVGLSCISLTGFVSFRVSHVQSMFHLLRSHFSQIPPAKTWPVLIVITEWNHKQSEAS